MTSRTHDAFAFACLITFAVYFPPTSLNLATLSISLIANIVGALIPDMDQATNRLWDLVPGGDFVDNILRKIFLQHRTLSHSFGGVFLVYKFLEWFLPRILNSQYVDTRVVFASIMVGYFSHLLADSFTKEGLPLLFPLKFKFGIPPISSLRITTDSFVEKYLVLPAIGTYLFWFISQKQKELLEIVKLVGR